MDLKESDILGKTIDKHWYYGTKALKMLSLLEGLSSRKILDVGAGSTFFSRYLLSNSDANEAWCIDTSYTADSDTSLLGKAIHCRNLIESATDIDLVLMMDVLEHVDDDLALLRAYVEMVPNGTKFLISVPAFQCLWSEHDDFLEHKRRYTLEQIELIAKNSGLKVRLGCYFFGLVLPVAVVVRFFGKFFKRQRTSSQSQLKKHHPIINQILMIVCKLECIFIKHNRLIGLTAFCFAEK